MRIKTAYVELLFIISALIMVGVYAFSNDINDLVYAMILFNLPCLYETLLKIAEYQDKRNNDEV